MKSPVLTRRERLRAATVEEIKATARRLLVREGTAGISLRAIGREMGMTGPALYRYFESLEELVNALCADLYDECREHLEAARDSCGSDDPGAQLYAVCRAFRAWSVAHPAEFGLMFGAPIGALPDLAGQEQAGEDDQEAEPYAAGNRFAGMFAALFAQIWSRRPFEVPVADDMPGGLAGQLESFVARLGAPLPLGAAQLFLSCWIRLYGTVSMEVFGHLRFALVDPEPMFEAELAMAARQIGVEPSAC